MNRKKWLVFGSGVVLLVCLFIGLRHRAGQAAWEQRIDKLRKLSSSQAENAALASLFLSPTKIEAFRMKPLHYSTSEPVIGKVDGFAYSAKRPLTDKALAMRLGALVLDPDTSLNTDDKSCAFNPTIAFRVSKEKEWADVVICFDCSAYLVVEPKVPIQEFGSVKAHFRVRGWFDNHRSQFLKLAKEAFPNDASIASLK